MNIGQVKTAIETTPKGANIIVEWLRPVKTKKDVTDTITKTVRMVGRIGIDYDHIAKVQTQRENGHLPSEPQPLPWGKWSIFPYLIEHNESFYLRLYNGTSDKVHPEVHFFLNGKEVPFEVINHQLLASEKTEKKGNCFTCKIEHMTRIHNEAEWMAMFATVEQEKISVESTPISAKLLATL